MQNILFSVNAVVPLFLMIFFGYYMRQKGILTEAATEAMNKICFKYALPAVLFRDLAASDFFTLFDGRLVGFAVVSVVVIFLLSWQVSARVIKDTKKLGSFVQGCYRSNYTIMGPAVMGSIYGGGAGMAAILVALIVPIYTVMGVTFLTWCGGSGKKVKPLDLLLDVVKNPLIIGIAIGLCFSVFTIPVPQAISKSVGYVASLGTPLAFFVVGARINLKGIFDKYSVVSTFVKLGLTPAIFVPAAVAIGLRGEGLMAFFVLMAAPSAISNYTMATNLGCDGPIAANSMFASTLCSVVTFTIGIAMIKSFGLA